MSHRSDTNEQWDLVMGVPPLTLKGIWVEGKQKSHRSVCRRGSGVFCISAALGLNTFWHPSPSRERGQREKEIKRKERERKERPREGEEREKRPREGETDESVRKERDTERRERKGMKELERGGKERGGEKEMGKPQGGENTARVSCAAADLYPQ